MRRHRPKAVLLCARPTTSRIRNDHELLRLYAISVALEESMALRRREHGYKNAETGATLETWFPQRDAAVIRHRLAAQSERVLAQNR
jgi:hypothetical protein